MLAAGIIGGLWLAGDLVVRSPEHPEVVINLDTDGLCIWVPESARDCTPEELQRFAALEPDAKADVLGDPLIVAFVREPGNGGDFALIVHPTRPPEPHVEGDELAFGTAQIELLCESPDRCRHHLGDEIGGVTTVVVSEVLPDRAYAHHTIFRGKEATVYTTLRRGPYYESRWREGSDHWDDTLDTAISLSPAPLEPAPPPAKREWIPKILQFILGLTSVAIGVGFMIARRTR